MLPLSFRRLRVAKSTLEVRRIAAVALELLSGLGAKRCAEVRRPDTGAPKTAAQRNIFDILASLSKIEQTTLEIYS